ncbi:sigma 54-interacting transcriptional regulator [Halioglobus japonicus]
MQSVDKTIDSLAYSDAIGFVVGESGTGKELAAESAHQHRKRCGNAFISISRSTIPGELITSELVGCIKVAFTGASSNREGVASVANGGTFFSLRNLSNLRNLRNLRNESRTTKDAVAFSSSVDEHSSIVGCAVNERPVRSNVP